MPRKKQQRGDSERAVDPGDEDRKRFPESEPVKNQGDKLDKQRDDSPESARDDFFYAEEEQEEPDH